MTRIGTDLERRVYPRVCGGTSGAPTCPPPRRGLSPRVRGNRGGIQVGPCPRGSIPACAGEPAGAGGGAGQDKVYPRVCGGTARRRPPKSPGKGLSPRVRGNPGITAASRYWPGSIPACAGEPLCLCAGGGQQGVYPRVCGGTSDMAAQRSAAPDLSPRVRGNQAAKRGISGSNRSIPACAGEPHDSTLTAASAAVYPRVCGGTPITPPPTPAPRGLSPRVRGNPTAATTTAAWNGSIPACAGEPLPAGWVASRRGVYPRVCGGTHVPGGSVLWLMGLSPRVRGNQCGRSDESCGAGSIPACAGEPSGSSLARRGRVSWVYPRVCGGTVHRRRQHPNHTGLSPRVRGNHGFPRHQWGAARSIPACAGEPQRLNPGLVVFAVYPRVCGGTRRR